MFQPGGATQEDILVAFKIKGDLESDARRLLSHPFHKNLADNLVPRTETYVNLAPCSSPLQYTRNNGRLWIFPHPQTRMENKLRQMQSKPQARHTGVRWTDSLPARRKLQEAGR